MARIKDTSVEEVKAAADMVSVVSERTQLRKAGARYMGRCPFHEERTPSFSVNAVDKFYYCFGCGAKGDLITFVRETEQLDFAEAIEWLADRFNVQIEYEETSPQQDARRRRRERLLELLEAAASFYERYLWDSQAGSLARDYLAGRGLGEEVCREYRLGLALGGTTLTRKALERGFTREELIAAGLVNKRGNDYFFGRLLFPLADARGRVLGFQARKLREDDPLKAKYVNSPEGELFRKGDLLYGLDRARAAIAKQERAVVVEGNTDVLALSQAGIEPVVASMGTALTERQLKELGRLTKRVWLCFDGDAAGEAATLRGMELAFAQGLDVRVVALPAGFDPADLAEGFEQRLARAESYLGYRVRLEIERAADRAGSVRPGARGALAFRGIARTAGRDPLRGGQARSAQGDAGRTCSPRSRVRNRTSLCEIARRGRAARAERARRGGGAPRRWCRCSPSSGPSTSTARSTGAYGTSWCRGASRTQSSSALSPSSTPVRPRKGSTSGPPRSFCSASGSARSGVSSARRIRPVPWSCKCHWPRSWPPSRNWPPLRPSRAEVTRVTRAARVTRSARAQARYPLPERSRVPTSAAKLAPLLSPVAQLAEHPAVNRRVVGSSPTWGAQPPENALRACFPAGSQCDRRRGGPSPISSSASHRACPLCLCDDRSKVMASVVS